MTNKPGGGRKKREGVYLVTGDGLERALGDNPWSVTETPGPGLAVKLADPGAVADFILDQVGLSLSGDREHCAACWRASGRSEPFAEIFAMVVLIQELMKLDGATRNRVIDWAYQKFYDAELLD